MKGTERAVRTEQVAQVYPLCCVTCEEDVRFSCGFISHIRPFLYGQETW